jgi:heat shock protein HslJ
MTSTLVRAAALTMAIVSLHLPTASTQVKSASWLDAAKPASWNKAGLSVPAAPTVQDNVDIRCRELARPPESAEDIRVKERGWDLVGAFHGGWQVVVIRGTAGYDGMCRPRQYQDFVFLRGTFAGTLSPQPMDSRSDGAIARVTLQGPTRLTAEYDRYGPADPLCCPSRTTSVVFDIASDGPIVRPVSTAPTAPQTRSGPPAESSLEGTSWKLVKFQGGDGATLTPDDGSKYTIAFAAGGRLSARVDCNRGAGAWKSNGPNQIALGPLALTRAACPAGSLHDQIVRQWGNIRSYVIRDGHLFLALIADGGIYELEPGP